MVRGAKHARGLSSRPSHPFFVLILFAGSLLREVHDVTSCRVRVNLENLYKPDLD